MKTMAVFYAYEYSNCSMNSMCANIQDEEMTDELLHKAMLQNPSLHPRM